MDLRAHEFQCQGDNKPRQRQFGVGNVFYHDFYIRKWGVQNHRGYHEAVSLGE